MDSEAISRLHIPSREDCGADGQETKIANKSYLRQEESMLVCSSRVQSITVKKTRWQKHGATGHIVFTNRKQKTTNAVLGSLSPFFLFIQLGTATREMMPPMFRVDLPFFC